MAEKTNKLTICLIKDDVQAFDDIVVAGARAHDIPEVGTFYCEESFVRTPDWLADFFGHALDGQFKILTASSKGVLLVGVERDTRPRIFAVLFGHGRHLLEDGVVEERFGLKAVLNSVDRGSLRSIEKTTLGSVPKQSREQMSRESEAASFGIDIETDLLNGITGRSRDPRLGKIAAGRDSLSISVKVDAGDIKMFLLVCLDAYLSDAYKTDFDWIDQIKDVRDARKIAKLNDWLVDRLKARELDKVWMAPPTVIDWVDVQGFRYGGKKRPPMQADLDIAVFLNSLGGVDISLDLLRAKSVHAISSRTDDATERWSAYSCIYAEANIDNQVFVLNNGKWYEIAPDFTAQVLADFNTMPESALEFPAYQHAKEGAYNVDLAARLSGSCCLDGDVISHGGGHSTIEFCDVFTTDNQLIHVKRYSGSAQLSHLFNQGVVSGELFVSDSEFRKKLNKKLPAGRRLTNPASRPVAGSYQVIFAIIVPPGKPLDIPFFSKVSLRNARRRLEAYGYSVAKKRIKSSSSTAAGTG